MHILIDTHIVLWSLYDSDRLSKNAVSYLQDPANRVYYSHVTVWETQIKFSIGKLPMSGEDLIRDCEEMGFFPIPIRKDHIIGLKNLPYLSNGHKDPFDRLLIAQALTENLFFLTADRKIMQYPFQFIFRED